MITETMVADLRIVSPQMPTPLEVDTAPSEYEDLAVIEYEPAPLTDINFGF